MLEGDDPLEWISVWDWSQHLSLSESEFIQIHLNSSDTGLFFFSSSDNTLHSRGQGLGGSSRLFSFFYPSDNTAKKIKPSLEQKMSKVEDTII